MIQQCDLWLALSCFIVLLSICTSESLRSSIRFPLSRHLRVCPSGRLGRSFAKFKCWRDKQLLGGSGNFYNVTSDRPIHISPNRYPYKLHCGPHLRVFYMPFPAIFSSWPTLQGTNRVKVLWIILFPATTDIPADISEKVVPFLGDRSEIKEFADLYTCIWCWPVGR